MSDKLDNVLPNIQAPSMTVAGRNFVLEPLCAYKVAQVLKAISRFSEDIKISEVVEGIAGTSGQMSVAQVAASFLPRLMTLAPDALVGMLSLAVIPNAELATLSDTPGAIEKRVAEEAKFFNFSATTNEVAELASLCIPLIGLEALKKSVPALGQRVMDTLGVQLQPPSTN